ncbi:hypothetical protein FVE85_5012 [Porphyridium purpureum]|uniref:Glycosyltransferase 61 catalytic domain-containing protein n=1 Tax=Porphyridium purpureum TaxID=35688 RepID=A0A5J4YRI0_PORPP|nr:hypothetical protein FVE85_5012 [Porphyridium purpureum]|eukprot:POR1068..scf236_6
MGLGVACAHIEQTFLSVSPENLAGNPSAGITTVRFEYEAAPEYMEKPEILPGTFDGNGFDRGLALARLRPIMNPNHFLHDFFFVIIFWIAQCSGQRGGALERITTCSADRQRHHSGQNGKTCNVDVSLPFLDGPALFECGETISLLDQGWQDMATSSGVGLQLRDFEHHPRLFPDISSKACTGTHAFAGSISYFAAKFLLASVNSAGGIVELRSRPPEATLPWEAEVAPHKQRTQEQTLLRFVVGHRHREELRRLRVKGARTLKRKEAIAQFRTFVLEQLKMEKEARAGSAGSTCRILLYTRNESGTHARVWVDAADVQKNIMRDFPHARVLLLHALPPRFADAVALFAGTDVLVSLHGGWEPNVMFMPDDAVVFNTPKHCSSDTGKQSGPNRWWMRSLQLILNGLRVHWLNCSTGQESPSHFPEGRREATMYRLLGAYDTIKDVLTTQVRACF